MYLSICICVDVSVVSWSGSYEVVAELEPKLGELDGFLASLAKLTDSVLRTGNLWSALISHLIFILFFSDNFVIIHFGIVHQFAALPSETRMTSFYFYIFAVDRKEMFLSYIIVMHVQFISPVLQ